MMDGAVILDRVLALLDTYVVLPSVESAHAVVLWIAATHALPALPAAPRLVIQSATKRSGKTRLLDLAEGMSHAPLVASNATPAAVFRSLDGDHPPTLLLDEVDTIFGPKAGESAEDLRGLLNAGFQRGKPALRCVGPQQIPTPFPTFAMVALAGIGRMPDTITDRAVVVKMRRRKPTERVAPFRERRDRAALDTARADLTAWLSDVDVREHLDAMEPDMPVEDRAAELDILCRSRVHREPTRGSRHTAWERS